MQPFLFRPASVLLILVSMVHFSCSDRKEPAVNADRTFYPLHVGSHWTYQVEETTYSESRGEVTNNYQLMLSVTDSFPDVANTYTYVIQRSARENDDEGWTNSDVWSARSEPTRFVLNEGNVAYVKLVFPANIGRAWDANTYNALGEDIYQVEKKGEPLLDYSDCLTVGEANEDNLVFTDIRSSVYARNIGLVYISRTQLNYCTDPDCLGDKIISDGIVYTQTLTGYGN